jgi:hypothetical protein
MEQEVDIFDAIERNNRMNGQTINPVAAKVRVSLTLSGLRFKLCINPITSACINAGLNKMQTIANTNL